MCFIEQLVVIHLQNKPVCKHKTREKRKLIMFFPYIMKRQFLVGYMWVKLTLIVHEHYLETSMTALGGVVLWHSNIS